jgi:hypothetical protein
MTSVDDGLTREATELLGPRHPLFAAARVTPSRTSLAVVGAPPDGDFEIGSISKGITGMLWAEAQNHPWVAVDSDRAAAPSIVDGQQPGPGVRAPGRA